VAHPKIKRAWRDEDNTSTTIRQNVPPPALSNLAQLPDLIFHSLLVSRDANVNRCPFRNDKIQLRAALRIKRLFGCSKVCAGLRRSRQRAYGRGQCAKPENCIPGPGFKCGIFPKDFAKSAPARFPKQPSVGAAEILHADEARRSRR
jgi:hypothetical protein